MKMKKWLIILMMAILVVTLSSCGGNNGGNDKKIETAPAAQSDTQTTAEDNAPAAENASAATGTPSLIPTVSSGQTRPHRS